MPRTPETSSVSPRLPKPLQARAAVLALRAEGLSEEQIARVAHTSTERAGAFASGTARPRTPRERVLIEFPPSYIKDLVEQQEALSLLFAHGFSRSDVMEAVDTTFEALKYWEGRETRIKRASGPRRQVLLAAASRLRTVLESKPDLNIKALTADAARTMRKRILKIERSTANAQTPIEPREAVQYIAKMERAGLWPAAPRVATLTTLIDETEQHTGHSSKSYWSKRFQITRFRLNRLLNPKLDVVLAPDLVEKISAAVKERKRTQTKSGLTARDRFMTAMKTLVGPTHFSKGFTTGHPDRALILQVLSKALGWSERNVRRHLPPYSPGWWEQRQVSLETVRKLEQLAAKSGRLGSSSRRKKTR